MKYFFFAQTLNGWKSLLGRIPKEESMDKNFACGMVLGLLGGALLVANSYKARKLVKDGQEEIKNKVSEITEKKGKKNSEDIEETND